MAQFINPITILIIFSLINMLNYVDRGIIPGAPYQFDEFIKKTLNVNSESENVYLGILQSSFIAGYAVTAPIFAHLVHRFQPFKLMAIGLLVWTFAVIVSGLSYYANSYYLLLVGRIISGSGEAAFQCIGPPWISDHAPDGKKTFWLGIFFTALPAGSSLGYIYGATMASSYGWQWAFLLESIIMYPLMTVCFFVPPNLGSIRGVKNSDMYIRVPNNTREGSSHIQTESSPLLINNIEEKNHERGKVPTVMYELCTVIKNPIFMFIVFGYGAYSASISGFAFFGPTYVLGRGFFHTETNAALVFGGIVAFSGLLGTPLGGYLAAKKKIDKPSTGRVCCFRFTAQPELDVSSKHAIAREKHKLMAKSFLVMTLFSMIGTFFMFLGARMNNKYAFMAFLSLGAFTLCIPTASITMVTMLCIPEEHRAFAIAIEIFIMHALGDVPSPAVFGILISKVAPGCSVIVAQNTSYLNPNCASQSSGLKMVATIAALWLCWTVLCFFIAGIIAYKKYTNLETKIIKL